MEKKGGHFREKMVQEGVKTKISWLRNTNHKRQTAGGDFLVEQVTFGKKIGNAAKQIANRIGSDAGLILRSATRGVQFHQHGTNHETATHEGTIKRGIKYANST